MGHDHPLALYLQLQGSDFLYSRVLPPQGVLRFVQKLRFVNYHVVSSQLLQLADVRPAVTRAVHFLRWTVDDEGERLQRVVVLDLLYTNGICYRYKFR